MAAIQNIMSRISVRQYSDREISEDALRTILEAGMAGPSCVNARDWSFIVVRDRDMLNRMADANGRPAEPLRTARLGIGSVWLGTWPQMNRVKAQAELFGLPETQIPHSIIAFGYPKETNEKEKLIWEADRVDYETW